MQSPDMTFFQHLWLVAAELAVLQLWSTKASFFSAAATQSVTILLQFQEGTLISTAGH